LSGAAGNNFEKYSMTTKKIMIFTLLTFLFTTSCEEVKKQGIEEIVKQQIDIEHEKEAILETLNNETKAAFQRDYEAWSEKWVHDSNITKIYIDFPESTFSESVGWNEISQFVKAFIDDHPEPEPIPKLLDKIDVRLYGEGAWVTYEQQDSLRGRKRETRLMEKVNGEWKIAGMQTTIYGFQTNENE
tara:strand:- start:39 stop:599 length:561 start_codon:yes stop_codon:yes gene_type:complete